MSVLDGLDVESLFVAEMVIDRRNVADAGPFENVANGGLVVALLRENFLGPPPRYAAGSYRRRISEFLGRSWKHLLQMVA